MLNAGTNRDSRQEVNKKRGKGKGKEIAKETQKRRSGCLAACIRGGVQGIEQITGTWGVSGRRMFSAGSEWDQLLCPEMKSVLIR